MKTKIFSYPAVIALLLCAVLNWSCSPGGSFPNSPTLNRDEVRKVLEMTASEPGIQAEVDGLLNQCGDKRTKPLYGELLSAAPGLVRFGNALSTDPRWDIETSGYAGSGVPSYVGIQFGTHAHYQFILIFATGTKLSAIKAPYEQVTNNIYFQP